MSHRSRIDPSPVITYPAAITQNCPLAKYNHFEKSLKEERFVWGSIAQSDFLSHLKARSALVCVIIKNLRIARLCIL